MKSYHKYSFSPFRRNNKAVGTVFGMVFFLLIVVIVFASFAVILTQSTNLEGTMIQTRQLDIDKANEHVLISNPDQSGNTFTCDINNTGTVAVELVRFWVSSGSSLSGSVYTDDLTSMNLFLAPGQLLNPSFSHYVNITVDKAPGDNAIVFITARGNLFSFGQLVGLTGANGTQGTQGTQGDPGTNGINGIDGTKWWSGTDYDMSYWPDPQNLLVDANGPARLGDYYFNTWTWDLFNLNSTGWHYLTTIGGSPAIQHGVVWYNDVGAASDAKAPGNVIGDYYLDTDTGNVWEKQATGWVSVFNFTKGVSSASTMYSLGPIAFDFDHFYAYDTSVLGTALDLSNLRNPAFRVTVAGAAKPSQTIAFALNLTNIDPYGRDIYLDKNSIFFGPYPGQGSYVCSSFGIVSYNSADGRLYALDGNEVVLYNWKSPNYNPNTFVYFACSPALLGGINPIAPADYGTAAFNIALIGRIGGGPLSMSYSAYGQNLPFASVYFSKP